MAWRREEVDLEGLTLEDVQLAIKIIRTYLRLVREAESALHELARYTSRGYRRPEDAITEAILQGALPQFRPARRAEEEEEAYELTEEERKRLEELKQKIRKKYEK